MRRNVYVIFFNLVDVVNLNEEDIRNNEIERVFSSWVTEFLDDFLEWFEGIHPSEYPRFLELRPFEYMLN